MTRYEWMSDAACAGRSDLFEEFDIREGADGREWSVANEVRIEVAKNICHTCPVLAECRAYTDRVEKTPSMRMVHNLSGMVAAEQTTRERVLRRRQEQRLTQVNRIWSA